LGVEQLLRIGYGRRGLDPVDVVEHDAQVADPADAGLRADRGQARLDPREAVGISGSSGRFKRLPVWLEISFPVSAASCC
jgi:hypothetical protein